MKLSLVLIICSAVNSTCLPPMDTGLNYNTWYDCMIGGSEQSIDFLKSSDKNQTNENKLFIKFSCIENIEEII
tara:strand:- start:969 stop:1187 length:219 start_codon:yes stop_codon:yes gene_type:complete